MNAPRIRCYDNGGKTADRYTVLYMDYPERNGCYDARGMNHEPFHPQGIGMSCSAAPGWHLGHRVYLKDLPPDCQKVVMQDLGGVTPVEDPWRQKK